jgi:2-phosphosulfolactate phosphatase
VTVYEQDSFDLRLEWGRDGVDALGPHCAVLIVVDVLVFTTTVDIALGRGGRVLPLPWRDERAVEAARAAGATLTQSGLAGIDGQNGGRTTLVADRPHGWTLRPSSLQTLPEGTFLAISSPNGATLCAAAAETGTTVLAGCLRNASAVAKAAVELADGAPIGIVPAGERWRDTPDRRLRPGIEEILGAGAIADAIIRQRTGTGFGVGRETGAGDWLAGVASAGDGAANGGAAPGESGDADGGRRWLPSAEAELAALTYRAVAERIEDVVADSVSGRELIAAGVPDDVRLASQVDASAVVPLLTEGVLAAR